MAARARIRFTSTMDVEKTTAPDTERIEQNGLEK
jgi:hypothetical protein